MSNAKRAIAALSITPSGYLKGSFPFENKTPIELNNNNRRAVAVVQQPNPLLMSRYRIGQQTGNPHDYNKTAFVNIPNSPIYKNSAGNGNNGNGTIAYKNNVPQNAVIDMKAVKADREAKSLLLAANAPLLHMY
jgi:hypothetical protein